jgi:hypothetical protein
MMHVAWAAMASSRSLSVSHVAARRDRGRCIRRHRVLDESLKKNRAFVSSQVAIALGALQYPRKLRGGCYRAPARPRFSSLVTA